MEFEILDEPQGLAEPLRAVPPLPPRNRQPMPRQAGELPDPPLAEDGISPHQ